MASAKADMAADAQETSSTDVGEDATTLVLPDSTTTEEMAKHFDPGNIQRVGSDPHAVYQRQRAAPPKLKEFSSTTCTHAEQFRQAVKAYQLTSDNPRVTSLDLEATHTWDQVIRLVKDNEAAYKDAGRKVWRRIARCLGSQAQFVYPWLRVIPNDFNASIVCGGLKCIFEAVMQLKTAREEIMSSLLRVPEIILEAEHKLETFNDDHALHDKVEELYVAILNALEAAVDWLKQNPFAKISSALVRGQSYNSSFKVRVEDLDHALGSLQRRADVLRDRSIVYTEGAALHIKDAMRRVEDTGKDLRYASRETLSHAEHLREDLKFVAEENREHFYTVKNGIETFTLHQTKADRKLDDLHLSQQTTQQHVESLNDVQLARKRADEALRIATRTAERTDVAERKMRRMEKQIKGFQEATYGIPEADLLEILDINENTIWSDCQTVAKRCQNVEAIDYDFARGVYQGERFNKWLREDSAALFLESFGVQAFHGRFSPLSVVTCSIIEQMKADSSTKCIYHFCHMHTSPVDSAPGPSGMLRSLTSQLLRLFPKQASLGFTSGRRYRDELQSWNIGFLCDCFSNVLKQLPWDASIICIIDGIDCFEKHRWAEDCRRMMRDLLDIVHEADISPVFKLLVTCPVRSRYAGAMFPTENRFQLTESTLESRDNPTERDILMSARRPRIEGTPARTLRTDATAAAGDTSESGCSWLSD